MFLIIIFAIMAVVFAISAGLHLAENNSSGAYLGLLLTLVSGGMSVMLIGQDARLDLAADICVNTIQATEGWEDMPDAALNEAVAEAVPATIEVYYRADVSEICLERLQASLPSG